MDIHYSVDVDSGLIDKATDELFACLWTQRQAYIERFEITKPVESILRILGLTLSVFGLLLCMAVALLAPSWCPVWLEIQIFIPAFLALALFFYYLPKMDKYRRKWIDYFSRKNCDNHARRCMSQLLVLVPLVIEYRLNGKTVTCVRCKNGQRTEAWVKHLSGVAFQGSAVTAFFKKKASIYPKAILLHRETETVNEVLKELALESILVDLH
jgi:hypothetical protein